MKNREGEKYGRLTILHVDRMGKIYRAICLCDCGVTTNKNLSNMLAGLTRSCGCLFREHLVKHGAANRKAEWPEYWVWHGMKQRCHYEKHSQYRYYGARGIAVCPRWRSSFSAFIEDMGRRPHPKMTIERMDNSKGYGPGNCKWATWEEQRKNKRKRSVYKHSA